MMIKFWDTHFADGTVFGSGGFDDTAGLALVVFLVYNIVVVRFEFLDLLLLILWGDLARRYWAGFVVDPETYKS